MDSLIYYIDLLYTHGNHELDNISKNYFISVNHFTAFILKYVKQNMPNIDEKRRVKNAVYKMKTLPKSLNFR